MPIEKNQVVLFHYSVRDEQYNVDEDSHGGIIIGLEGSDLINSASQQ